ncbi:hypothetical protein [Enterococcus sp. DIV2324]|uniref:hypothetical protein n=1 Tax=Enterococcus sp. DIV2324 TaxID=2774763 RepID=UPI003F288FE4
MKGTDIIMFIQIETTPNGIKEFINLADIKSYNQTKNILYTGMYNTGESYHLSDESARKIMNYLFQNEIEL